MPSLIEGDDRQTVKRTVPKASNKIHAVAVAKLYVAYPDRQRWTYTGLQGAAVLANDLVGNTFWIKMVDISPANRGVIWDQEIFDTFQYNQDRVFFHSFETEKCMAGFSFADDKEARKFKQKMDEREKNAHKNTKGRPFGNAAGQVSNGATSANKSHGILGGFGNLLHRDRQPSGQQQQMQSIIPPQDPSFNSKASPSKDSSFEDIDPSLLDELLAMGITEDQLAENADFIRGYIGQKNTATNSERKQRAPPPAPPSISPQGTGGSGRRGPPPAPPQPRRGGPTTAPSPRERSPSPTAEPASPPAAAKRWNFRAPPPLEGAGKFAGDFKKPASPRTSTRTSSGAAHPGPAPPPRPPKTPIQDGDDEAPKFGVPPPFEGERVHAPPPPPRTGGAPPAPPPRSSGGPPPPPPPRETHAHAVPPAMSSPPPLPPKTADGHGSGPPPPPPSRTPHAPSLPSRDAHTRSPPQAPPSLPSRDAHSPSVPPPPPARNDVRSVPAPPPPPPPQPSGGAVPPPPPPPPSSSGPPPPAPPPPPALPVGEAATANAPALPSGGGGRDNLLADIRGGARLKRVSDAEKNDRSAAQVPGGESSAPAGSGGSAPGGGSGDQGGLAGALASALAARKSKVAHSDDEDDKDDW